MALTECQQHIGLLILNIFLSSNGRTSGFEPLNRSSNLWGKTFGVVAQLAERFLCKEEDEGSNPFCSTIGKFLTPRVSE